MAEEAVALTPEQEQQKAQQEEANKLASAVWSEQPVTKQEEQKPEEKPAPVVADDIIDTDEYFKQHFGGLTANEAKERFNKLTELEKNPPKPEPLKFENEDSRKYFEAITKGDAKEIYSILHKQNELERLEKLQLEKTTEALDVLRTNLLYKNQNLKPEDVDFLLEETYAKPAKPIQSAEQTDEDYKLQVDAWQQQVQRIDRKMIIDAKLAQPEIATYKSKLVLPEIKNDQPSANQPSQEDLAALETLRNQFTDQLKADTKFGGYSVTAKDGEVELPISYVVTPEERTAFNGEVEKAVANINEYLDNELGWWNKDTKTFNISKMQEDLYLLKNRGNVFQKIANESAAQRKVHDDKVRNNIKLNGAGDGGNNGSSNGHSKTVTQEVAETIWKM